MPNPTVEAVFSQARALLRDTQVVGGEDYTDTVLAPYFQEAYRRLFACLAGGGVKRVQRLWYLNFPANTTVLIPAIHNVVDLFEPIMVEERMAAGSVSITSTSNTIPIIINAPGHGLSTGTEVIISDVAGTTAPWGVWFATVIDTDHFSINGSMADGSTGTGGYFTVPNNLQFTQVIPIDLADQGLDGNITSSLQVYLWQNQQFMFRGASEAQQLRVTYWCSGNPPTNTATVINIDNSVDCLAYSTAASAAQASGWRELSDTLMAQVYGPPGSQGIGLLADFLNLQVRQMQKGPQRRQLPFRAKRSRFGSYIVAG